MKFATATLEQIEAFRQRVATRRATCIVDAAQFFVSEFAKEYPETVLVRIFGVLPFSSLREKERAFAASIAGGSLDLREETPALSLLGTYGRKPAWQARATSRGHLAIPLLNQQFIEGAPMVSALLGSVGVDFKAFADHTASFTRLMAGGRNGAFYVRDARVAKDDRGRLVIPAQDFVEASGVRTVFGMGGAYFNGMIVAMIVFTDQIIERPSVDRFPSLISHFKMATMSLVASGAVFG
jgi:hypothetical protein